MIWGRQDPHIPLEGRMKVLARLNEVNVKFSWHEVKRAHAFLRDEGRRYDPELAYQFYGLVFRFLFDRRWGFGYLPVSVAGVRENERLVTVRPTTRDRVWNLVGPSAARLLFCRQEKLCQLRFELLAWLLGGQFEQRPMNWMRGFK